VDSEPAFVIVLTTFPADQDPEPLARALVDERLAACVNVLPVMQSTYRWKGAIERADERQLVIKTRKSLIRELETRIRQLHPYDVPEFLVIPVVDGSVAYFSWLAENA
jgi:periplasmic divalent cation tolerance protein